MPKAATPRAPSGLSDDSKRLWRDLHADWTFTTSERSVLEEGLRARDRLHQVQEVLAREGVTTTNPRSGVVHLHPLCAVEKTARAGFLAAMAALKIVAINDKKRPVGRPVWGE